MTHNEWRKSLIFLLVLGAVAIGAGVWFATAAASTSGWTGLALSLSALALFFIGVMQFVAVYPHCKHRKRLLSQSPELDALPDDVRSNIRGTGSSREWMWFGTAIVVCSIAIFAFTADWTWGLLSLAGRFAGVTVSVCLYLIFAMGMFVVAREWHCTLSLLGWGGISAAVRVRRLASLRKFKLRWWSQLIWAASSVAAGLIVWNLAGPAYGGAILLVFCVALPLGSLAEHWKPPIVHLLASSSNSSTFLHQKIAASIGLLRVTSLLYTDVSIPSDHAVPIVKDIFRTSDIHDWRRAAFALAEMAPVVVMDTRIPTGPVLEEIQRMIGANMIYKVIFLADASGTCPGLDALQQPEAGQSRPAMCITNEDGLFPLLAHMSSGKANLPSPGRTAASIQQSLRPSGLLGTLLRGVGAVRLVQKGGRFVIEQLDDGTSA